MIDPITAGTATAAAVGTISGMLQNLQNASRRVVGAKETFDKSFTTSLSESIKDAMVSSTVYFEEDLFDDRPLLENLLGMINQIYGGYILSTLGLDSMIGDCRVRDMLKRIATEEFVTSVELADHAMAKFLDEPVAMEATTAKIVDRDSTDLRIGAGKTLEVQFVLSKDVKVTAYVHVQLFPVPLAPQVASTLISLNYHDSLAQRWKKFRAKEISFWSDFLFCSYELKRMDTALRKDKTNVLAGALVRRSNALTRAWLSILDIKKSSNTASTVLIIDKRTFQRACADAGVVFTSATDRNAFFKKSMMLMVLVVDQDYQTVDMYTHGLSQYGSYPFSSIEKVSKGGGLDMKTLMALLSQGQSPRF